MKIVINSCFGGFGISNEALFELIKMKSKVVNKFTIKEYYGGNNPINKKDWKQDWKEEKTKLKPFKLGMFSHEFLDGLLYDNEFVYYLEDNSRDNLDLIKIIEKLGEKANGDNADLTVIEIPDGTSYEIDYYDGLESIEESHRSWS